jgi:hypothetical protein
MAVVVVALRTTSEEGAERVALPREPEIHPLMVVV